MRNKLVLIIGVLLIMSCEQDNVQNEYSGIISDYIALYLLNGNADDTSENENNGKVFGLVSTTENRNGTPDLAMNFNKDYGYIDVYEAEQLETRYQISISVWVKADDQIDGWSAILSKWNTNSYSPHGYYLGINPVGLRLRWNLSSNILELDTSFPLNRWTHIVATYDGTNMKLYLDGELVDQLPFSGFIDIVDVPLRIGSQSDYSDSFSGFHGAIDDVLIYNRALDEVEVERLYIGNMFLGYYTVKRTE